MFLSPVLHQIIEIVVEVKRSNRLKTVRTMNLLSNFFARFQVIFRVHFKLFFGFSLPNRESGEGNDTKCMLNNSAYANSLKKAQ